MFVCNRCSSSFTTRAGLGSHQRRHVDRLEKNNGRKAKKARGGGEGDSGDDDDQSSSSCEDVYPSEDESTTDDGDELVEEEKHNVGVENNVNEYERLESDDGEELDDDGGEIGGVFASNAMGILGM